MNHIRILTFTGRSGSGKTTIIRELFSQTRLIKFIPSTTTRSPRPSDLPGEYEHITTSEFEALDRLNRFAWKAEVSGKQYGSRKEVLSKFIDGEVAELGIMILVPEVITILRALADGKTLNVFVVSPPEEILKKRMQERGDSDESITKRLAREAAWEEKCRKMGGFYFLDNRGPLHLAVAEAFQMVMQSRIV